MNWLVEYDDGTFEGGHAWRGLITLEHTGRGPVRVAARGLWSGPRTPATSAATGRPGGRYRHGMPSTSRDRQILDAAATLFFEKGYGAVGVDEIGLAAGVTGPAVYRHFHGKDEILAALFDEAIDGLLRATGGRFADPVEELEFRVRAHAEYVLTEQKLASVWTREDRSLSPAHRKRLHRREVQYVETWIDLVKRAMPGFDGRAADRAALLALGTLNGVALWPARPLTGREFVDVIVAFVIGGLHSAADHAS